MKHFAIWLFIAGTVFIGMGLLQICLPFIFPYMVGGVMFIIPFCVAASLFLGSIAACLINKFID